MQTESEERLTPVEETHAILLMIADSFATATEDCDPEELQDLAFSFCDNSDFFCLVGNDPAALDWRDFNYRCIKGQHLYKRLVADRDVTEAIKELVPGAVFCGPDPAVMDKLTKLMGEHPGH
jgi:hypothetical protein